MAALIDDYDAALFDLDGVVYLGPDAVPGVPAALEELHRGGTRLMFVTNNAARPAQVVVDQLVSLGVPASLDTVLTSAQVAASALVAELSPGARVLVAGSPNLVALLRAAGFEIVQTADDHPAAVVQGYDPELSWRMLDEAALAIQAGARWYATNSDASRPTDRGLVPGVGGAISVIATALGGRPTIFGKPDRPMLAEAARRSGASRPIFIGDRIDTDIVGAANFGMDSMLVFSGAHGKYDLLMAPPEAHPTYIGHDVADLLVPARVAYVDGGRSRCRDQRAVLTDGTVRLETKPAGNDEQLDALWAVVNLAWKHAGADARDVLASLHQVP